MADGTPPPPPPPPGDDDRGPAAVAFLWTTVGTSAVVVALRFVGRRMIRSTGADDWMMLFTLVSSTLPILMRPLTPRQILFILFAAFTTKDVSLGGMRHLYYLSPAEATDALKWNWLAQPWVIMGFATGKISVGLLILRLLPPNVAWRKWIVWGAVVAAFVFSAVNVILTFAQCSPVSGLWDPTLLASGQATCWSPLIQTRFAEFLSGWNIFTDTLLALLPITLFWRLNISWQKKLRLSVLLGLGVSAAVCAIVKTTFLVALSQRSDLTCKVSL